MLADLGKIFAHFLHKIMLVLQICKIWCQYPSVIPFWNPLTKCNHILKKKVKKITNWKILFFWNYYMSLLMNIFVRIQFKKVLSNISEQRRWWQPDLKNNAGRKVGGGRSYADIYAVVMYLYPCNVLLFLPMQIKLNVPESSKHLYCTRVAHTKFDDMIIICLTIARCSLYLIII